MDAHFISDYLAIVMIKIGAVLAIFYIIKKMQNSMIRVDDIKYWVLYFVTALMLSFVHTFYTFQKISFDLFHMAVIYMVVAIMMMYNLNEGLRKTFTTLLFAAGIVFLLIVDLIVNFSDFDAMLIFVLTNFVLYGYIVYLAIKRGREFKNHGFYIIAIAAVFLVYVSIFAAYYLIQNEVDTVFAIAEFGANVAFIGAIIGFLAINIFNETKFLNDVALTDPLTKMRNRRGLDYMLSSIIPSSNRSFRCFSVMSIDIDHFKSINDTYGHDGGDVVLQKFAEMIKENHRNNDISCRFGGEEFILVLPDTNKVEVLFMAEKLRKTVEESQIKLGENILRITASFGVATSCNKIDIDKLFKESDKALYTAKHAGRNRVVQADSESSL